MTNLNLGFGHELVVDNFAGGGGASEGIEQALGRPVDLAINHDAAAIATHTANHPGTEHAVADVWDVNPDEATNGQPVGLAWFSPDCRHHSKAKGGRPVSKSVRGLAWVSARWAALVKPRVIKLENVEEFLDWGPLVKNAKGQLVPDPARKGQTFRGFVRALKRHGYAVDWRILRACDYGTPTIRKRLFLIARRDGLPITWPKPTHGDPKSPAVQRGTLQAYRTAAECIDWSLPCPSIFGRKRELVENTMKRIAKGVMRYVIDSESPFIAPPGGR
ncbi:DNA cytosine methyltransferase [Salinicola aestuarinus]|uniref:DNA cytosine methyltransferase n=1 Tax=Salinicola aestuarinus TaxID=1949082 RepID=UPI001FDA934B|nr:DNA cytosine methyltransferase [Salinicola aestuarinus]